MTSSAECPLGLNVVLRNDSFPGVPVGVQVVMPKEEFELLARGEFQEGLKLLRGDPNWGLERVDAPMFLGFPHLEAKKGWGESLLMAKIAKRFIEQTRMPQRVAVPGPVRSLLEGDGAFTSCTSVASFRECPTPLRSPICLLEWALKNPKLPGSIREQSSVSRATPPKIGIAWRSVDENGSTIWKKSIALEQFLNLFDSTDIQLVSLQRGIKPGERETLQSLGRGLVEIIEDSLLDDETNQKPVASKIEELDLMVTISTTTAHLGGYLDVDTIVLTSNRGAPQWFWPVQKRLPGIFYPSVRIAVAERNEGRTEWWRTCFDEAKTMVAEAI